MKLRIVFEDGSVLVIESVESIRLSGRHEIVTNTFGNNSVTHKRVMSFETEFIFDLE